MNNFAENAYFYSSNYDKETERNLTEAEWKGLIEVKSDRSIVVLKGDKRKCAVLLKRDDYVEELENLLSDKNKLTKLDKGPTIKREERLVRYLL